MKKRDGRDIFIVTVCCTDVPHGDHDVLRGDHGASRGDHGVPRGDYGVSRGAYGVPRCDYEVLVYVPRGWTGACFFHRFDGEQYFETNEHDRHHGCGGDCFVQLLLPLR